MTLRLDPRALAGLWLVTAGCASLSTFGAAREAQLTAAVADFREGTRDALVLVEHSIRPMEANREGEPPNVRGAGRHDGAWLQGLLAEDLVDRLCSDPSGDECRGGRGVLVIRLSEPFDAGRGVFIDAELHGVTDTGVGLLRFRRAFRLQIVREGAGWRVVASTPLWETTG